MIAAYLKATTESTTDLDRESEIDVESPNILDELNRSNYSALTDVLQNAGKWAYGIIAVEVWVQNNEHTRLIRPEGGFWVDPVVLLSQPSEELSRVTDRLRKDYLPAFPLASGESLAGALWSDCGRGKATKNTEHQLHNRGQSFSHNSWSQSFRESILKLQLPHFHLGFHRNITWRDINQLANDPDQPYNERIKLFSKAGLGIAAGVPFQIRGYSGIVVYMARSTVDMEKARSASNEAYLQSSSDMIGATLALREPLCQVYEERIYEKEIIIRKIKSLMSGAKPKSQSISGSKPSPQAKLDLKKDASNSVLEFPKKWFTDLKQRCKMWKDKLRGVDMMPPPPTPLDQMPFLFLSIIIQMLLICGLSSAIHTESDGELHFRVEVLAVFTSLQYCLTGAAAAQPGIGISGIGISYIVGTVCSCTPMSLWVRQATAAALAISIMAKVGTVHPPAAGMSIVFSSGLFTVLDFGLFLSSYIIAILMSTAINNLSEARQYPMFWGAHYMTYLHIKYSRKFG